MSRKQLAQVIDEIIDAEPNIEKEIAPVVVEEYKKLNDKCDVVINKIKTRKRKKKNSNQSGE